MEFSAKTLSRLAALVLLAYAAALVIGLYMPLQTDEVGYLFLNHRALIDGGRTITLLPQCGKQVFSMPLPGIWYLPAYLNDLTYARVDHPLWVRIGGFVQFFLWLALWVAIAIKLFAVPRSKWWLALAVMLAVLSLDVLPLGLLVNRPEQILLIGTGLFTATALYAKELSSSKTMRVICMLLLAFAACYMHSVHAKALFLLPLELAMTAVFLQAAWGQRTVTLAGTGIVLWIALQSYGMVTIQLQCPGSDFIRSMQGAEYLSPATLRQAPLMFFLGATLNLFISVFSALNLHSHLIATPAWLPVSLSPLGAFSGVLASGLDEGGWLIHAGLLIIAVTIFFRQTLAIYRVKTGKASAALPPFALYAGLCTLLIALGAMFAVLTTPFFYAVTLSVPLVVLASMLALRLKYEKSFPPSLPKFATLLMGFAIVSQAFLFYRYGAFITEPEAHNSTVGRRLMTTSAWGYEAKLPAIKALAEQCHIGTDRSVNHPVLDDTTYFLFHYAHEPMQLTYSTWLQDEFDPAQYLKFLKSYDSDGVIAECANFPSKLLPYAVRRGDFCCIPKAAIK